ncbi:MAG TPA: hypothetical protein VM076_20940 [Gemmatimonadaceae bacterium]|nr:hypothetical protein [Gemmatimonadaceae bacterium]
MSKGRNGGTGLFRDETPAPEPRARTYVDRAGIVWSAYERRRPEQLPALVFESPNAIRIVRDFPDDWYTLPHAALEALSWGV